MIGGANCSGKFRVNTGSFGKELRIVTYGRSREPGGALSGEIKPRGLIKKTPAP